LVIALRIDRTALMATAALVVSVLAVVIAGGALFFTSQADRRDRHRAEREEADARARQRANPSTGYLGRAEAVGGRRAYRFRVFNRGQAAARDLKASLIDREGNAVSHDLPYLNEGTGFLDSSQLTDFEIAVREEALDRNPLFLHFVWTDDRGVQEHTSDVKVPAG
jgi:hypothetical protein